MKKIIFISVWFIVNSHMLLAQEEAEQDQETKHPVGIGIRLGDFNGISAQYFLTKQKISFGLDFGRSYFFKDDYEKRFDKYAKENNIDYITYYRERVLEGRSVGFKFNISKYGKIGKIPHFYWYGGVGFQARNFNLSHSFSEPVTAANSSIVKVNDVKISGVEHQSRGLDFIIGSEYVFQEFPLVFFVDLSMFVEVSELQNQLMGQMGLGARVHF